MLKAMSSLRTLDWWLIGVFTIFSIYVYWGFFSPDSYTLAYGSFGRRILWAIWICLPIVYVGIVVLYSYIRVQKIGSGPVSLLLATTLICSYICYNIADVLYQGWFDSHRHEYHPFLQLMPKDYSGQRTKPANVRTIFCLGGSTTELPDSAGVDWPSRVQTILRTRYRMENVEVYNLGRQWYTSLHTLINYEANLRQYRPSVILIMQSVNDLLQNADFSYLSRGTFRDDYGHFYGPVNRIIDRRSLWKYLRDVMSGLWYAKPRRALTTDRFPGLTSYVRNITTLVELAARESTKVVLMTEPSLIKRTMTTEELAAVGMLKVEAINDTMVWSVETVLTGMEQYNSTLRTIAHEHNLLLIDLDREIPKSLTFFRDEVHYRDTTFSLIAPIVAQHLHELLSPDQAE
jgi:hypothetical protein